LKYNPPHLCLLTSWVYRCEPLHLVRVICHCFPWGFFSLLPYLFILFCFGFCARQSKVKKLEI
jgi:hypothetical protein